MLTPDTRFRTYLKAFFTDLLTGMSGPLSVPFVIAALWVSSRTQKTLYASLAVVCAMFASYRVWRKDRRDTSAQLVEKDSELAELNDRVVSLTASLAASQQKPKLKVKVSAEGNVQSRVLKVVADRPITVSRVDYMLSTEAAIAGEDVSLQGESFEIPINDGLLLKVWNTPRSDRNNYDHSGPAKIGITVSADGQSHQFILPVQMANTMDGNTVFRTVIGSKTFQERV
jgi:hypothetical protein